MFPVTVVRQVSHSVGPRQPQVPVFATLCWTVFPVSTCFLVSPQCVCPPRLSSQGGVWELQRRLEGLEKMEKVGVGTQGT